MENVKLALKPFFDDAGEAQYIDICMTSHFERKVQGDPMFKHILSRGPVKTMQYDQNSISMKDPSECTISLYCEDLLKTKERVWYIKEDLAAGHYAVGYRATSRIVDEHTQCGPQIALEKEGGGLTAAGMAFLLNLYNDDVFADISIEWDLSTAPSGSRAVCTFGEGPMTSIKEKFSVLQETFFAVAPGLNSYPTEISGTTADGFAMYWIDQPPFDVAALGMQMRTTFEKMSDFFQDGRELYRIFIRHNPYKCASGRGIHRGFVFAWTSIVLSSSDHITEFLFHETVHNWPRLGLTKGMPDDFADGWFNEGIAEYYSLILPYRFGIFSEDEFVFRLNRRISGYYTNADRSIANKDIFDNFWKPGRIDRVPYQRGFMYFLKLACQLDRTDRRSLDDLILEMVSLRTNGKPHGIQVWLSLLTDELGPAILDEYHKMSEGQLIILPEDLLKAVTKADWRLQRHDQEEFYLGFPQACLYNNPRIVKGLDSTSRAALEGNVQEGDAVTQKFSFFYIAEHWEQRFSMTVRRENGSCTNEEQPNGENALEELTWWPRSWHKVESYQFALG